MFLHAFCSHCHTLDEVPTPTEHACYKVQSNLYTHKKYNMPSIRFPYQISKAQPEEQVTVTDKLQVSQWYVSVRVAYVSYPLCTYQEPRF